MVKLEFFLSVIDANFRDLRLADSVFVQAKKGCKYATQNSVPKAHVLKETFPSKSAKNTVVDKGPLSEYMQGFRDRLDLDLSVDGYNNESDEFPLTQMTTCNVMTTPSKYSGNEVADSNSNDAITFPEQFESVSGKVVNFTSNDSTTTPPAESNGCSGSGL